MELWELPALRNSMEVLMVQERFQELFTEQEIAEARRRLNELEYFSK